MEGRVVFTPPTQEPGNEARLQPEDGNEHETYAVAVTNDGLHCRACCYLVCVMVLPQNMVAALTAEYRKIRAWK